MSISPVRMSAVQNPPYQLKRVGRSEVEYVGLRKSNIGLTLKRTIVNRSEASLMLQGTIFSLMVPPKLQKAVETGIPPTTKPDDPFLKLSPGVQFDYMTEADVDAKGRVKYQWRGKGTSRRKHFLHSRLATFKLGRIGFFTRTSKMSAPSFSIGAGPPDVEGTCLPAELYRQRKAYDTALLQGDVSQHPPDVKNWICAYCYAGKSNYMHRTTQYTQLGRWLWLMGMMNDSFDDSVEVVGAILEAQMMNRKVRAEFRESPNYFRIHDSGDLTLVPNTYMLWREVAALPELSHIHFWAPTRMWVFPKFSKMVRDNPPPPNLSLRPSALHLGDIAPGIPGFTAGSTAHQDDKHKQTDPIAEGLAGWVCPAYQHDGKSCQGGGGPDGQKDCRVCWDYRDLSVSYRAH